jgi:prenyltransferase beta subunit
VSLRLEMLQIARLASGMLNESAELVEAFILSHQDADGGFMDRDGTSDLYYTVFAIDGLSALQSELPQASIEGYLATFGNGQDLDFVHRCCLARARAAIRHDITDIGALLLNLEQFRTPDGGYKQKPGASNSTAYGCLLAYGAYSDHGLDVPGKEKFTDCLNSLQTPDGGWGNEPGMAQGTVSAAAAAVVVSRCLHLPIPQTAAPWLIGCAHPEGGFRAFPEAPIPDLLSTAVSLHALEVLQADYSHLKEACLDFVDSLWVNDGGFHGHWADDDLDLEYTYYGLLALGHLSL